MVECDLAKVEVAGSNPVSRSIFLSLGASAPQLAAFVTSALRGRLHSAAALFGIREGKGIGREVVMSLPARLVERCCCRTN